MFKMKDKVAVITGAADGIGLGIAKKLLENGARAAIIIDINAEKGAEAALNLNKEYGDSKAKFFKCDVTKDLYVADEIIKEYNTIDILVNSAGIIDESDCKRLIDINVSATIEWANKFYNHMRIDKNGKGGTIINISSTLGFRINRCMSTYQASKFAVMGFTRSLGHIKNFEKTGVKVMAICPGFTRTGITRQIKEKIKNKTMPDGFLESISVTNYQEPEAVGEAAVEVLEKAQSGTAWLIEDGVFEEVTNGCC